MASNVKQEELKYDGSAKVSSKGTAILGKLTGPCADTINPTRNGRKYSNELWEKVFQDSLVKEQFANGGIFGEMNHPADRDEVDLTQVCVCMPEPPKKNSKGELIASWDILDTPNGRILKTLCDYGYKLGISSRGTGDIIEGYDGQESVDPESYQLNAWDIVLIPAVKSARLDYVTEGLNSKKTLKQALMESLNNASESDRKIMEDTLSSLDVDLIQNQEDSTEESVDDIETTDAVDNNEAIVEELQNSIKQISTLQSDILVLQEKLSVCYAKESTQEDEIVKLRLNIQKLSEDVKRKEALENQIKKLNEKLEESNSNNLELNRKVEASNQKLADSSRDYRSLTESVRLREHEVSALKSNITSLNKQIASLSKEKSDAVNNLTEQLETLKKDSKIQAEQYTKKLANANKLVEKYRVVANKAIDKYIESEAVKLGIKKEEIKNKLPQTYTFNDIDRICEDLRSYKLSIDRLPFNVTESVKMKPKQSTYEPILPVNRAVDDDVDSALIEMAGLK